MVRNVNKIDMVEKMVNDIEGVLTVVFDEINAGGHPRLYEIYDDLSSTLIGLYHILNDLK